MNTVSLPLAIALIELKSNPEHYLGKYFSISEIYKLKGEHKKQFLFLVFKNIAKQDSLFNSIAKKLNMTRSRYYSLQSKIRIEKRFRNNL